MPQRLFVLFGLLAVLVVSLSWSAPGRATAAQTLEPIYPTSPDNSLMFIENVGQFAADARFQVRGSKYTIWLAEDAIWVTILEPAVSSALPDHEGDLMAEIGTADIPRRGVNLRLSFVGANQAPLIEATGSISTTISYFLGNDPDQWQPDVPVWGSVRYVDLYPGLDLEVIGQGGTLVPRLVCHTADCAAALTAVQLEVAGAEEVMLAGESLHISTAVGEWRLPLLAVVDEAGRPVGVSVAEVAVEGNHVQRPFASPPPALSATPDNEPAGSGLLYSTFLGGTDSDLTNNLAMDEGGNTFISGYVDSPDFPTTPGAFNTDPNGSQDVSVTKLSADGSSLLYSTFLGGDATDASNGIAIDEAGNAYITGYTVSSDFPTTPGAFDTTFESEDEAYVTKLNATGSALLYSTFLGSDHYEEGMAIAVDAAGHAFVTGYTHSSDFPTTPDAFDPTYNGSEEAFVTKLNLEGSSLLYSTFLGGTSIDGGIGITIDQAGNAFVTGQTYSSNFPTTPGAFDTTHSNSYGSDAFVTKLNATGSALLYSTFLGGEDLEFGAGITVDELGNAFVTGGTRSIDFPTTPDAFDTVHGGNNDVFVTKLDATGSGLLYSTFLGAGGFDYGYEIAIDEAGIALITGATGSPLFPTTPGAFDTTSNGSSDAFVIRLNATGSEVLYGTFLGGTGYEAGHGLAIDGAGNALVTGETSSPLFPTTLDAFDTTFNGDNDIFVVRLVPVDAIIANFTADPLSGVVPLEVVFSNHSTGAYDTCLWDFGDGNSSDSCLDPVHTYSDHGTFTVTLTVSGTEAVDTLTMPDYIVVHEYEPVAAAFTVTPTVGIAPLTVYLTNLSIGVFDTCLWDFGDGNTSEDCEGPVHTYTQPDSYDISLTVTGLGGEDTFEANNAVVVYEPVTAGFTAVPTSGHFPLYVVFFNESSGDYDTCLWDLGDGYTTTGCNYPTRIYTAPGTYTIALTVSGDGGSETLTKQDYITVFEPAMANFSASPTDGLAPLPVDFTNLSSGAYDTCLWDFGDGATNDACDDPSHVYTMAGSYTVKLTVMGPFGGHIKTMPGFITVYEPVTANFTAVPTGGPAPLTVTFSNLSTGDYDTCSWDFGDGGTSDACDDPDHTYNTPGSYEVSLTVTGPGGEDTFTAGALITVYEPVTAGFTATFTSGAAPLLVQFTNLSTGDHDTCLWDFGDGSTSDDCDNPVHTYSAPGTYTVTLTVSGLGGEDTLIQEAYITVKPYQLYLPILQRTKP